MSSTPAEPAGLLRLARNVSLSQIVAAIAIIVTVRVVTTYIHRIYFHPLSKFPGPKSRAASWIPSHIGLWTGTNHLRLAELHRKYGHVVRTSPTQLSWTDPDAWKDIYGHGTKGTPGSNPHKNWNHYGASPNGSYNLIQAHDADHARMRKIFGPAFSDRALKQQEPLFLRYVDMLVSKFKEAIDKNPSAEIDLVKLYNFTTFDIMGDLTFGEPLHMLENAEYDPWVSVIFSSIKIMNRVSILIAYPWVWKAFKALIPESINKKGEEHFQHSVTRVTKRLEKGRDAEGVDLWDLVLGQQDGKGLSRGEMDANASVFMVAGTETTATLLSGLTYLLLRNPKCLAQVVDEIRSAFTSADDMTMETLAALPYLAACIKEAFRLYPPVPLGLPRLVPQDGSTIVGTFVPPGTTLTIPQLAMYTSEKNFTRPMEYLPERWLGGAEFEADQRQAVQPFSVGTRDCVGKNMAYHEIRLVISKVLYNFDLELCAESGDWAEQETFILWQKTPLMCRLKAVN
ncbi:cytochrome P450 [Dothidotthia symphoricarpi CBS 119687]|uniref:Cytochrome P450 n=1 Tax=Dothidotthia symphoricarpi CBS 119687 TaxID=1392245 RepID=A0A6A6ARC9_9PLEO|nr:cytochrome P450 [Dothidotthia symphoricarpi CBS 119687]KAF2133504.1 cytochrome P450 [Dothidotthia symphoricarpi CBS 119687]